MSALGTSIDARVADEPGTPRTPRFDNRRFRRPQDADRARHLDVTVVVPCRNESENVGPLLDRLAAALADRRCQVILVDDSDNPDTVAAAELAAGRHDPEVFAVTAVWRVGPQRWGGLSGAVIDGLRLAQADHVVVMDADLQHPPETVPALLDRFRDDPTLDVVVASRYTAGGSAQGLDGPVRKAVSVGSTGAARALFPIRLAGVSDPMTGFFAVRREAIDLDALRPRGFKILLEILVRNHGLRRAEVPLVFEARQHGQSKGDLGQGIEYVRQLMALRASAIGRGGRRATQRPDGSAARSVPRSRVGSFAVGGGLTAVGGALLLEALISAGVARMVAFAIQMLVTLAANFLFNYLVTWRDRERSGLPSQVGWYLGTRLSTLLWSWLGFGLLTGVLNLHHQLANAICLLAAAVVNYYLSDRVVFAEPDVPTGRRSLRLARWLVGVSAVAAVTTLLVALDLSTVQALTLGAAVIAVFNLLVGFLDVRWRMYGWRDPDAIRQMRWPEPSPTEAAVERFSLIVPALREAAVIGTTLRRLLQSEYQNFEIIVTLCEGDDETLAEVRRVMAEDDPLGRIRVVVRAYEKSNKPRQLNAALAECTGTVVGVIDAEDDVSPGLLARVDAMFQRTGADIVQGGVQLMTLGRGPREWFKVHNVMEYYFWFTSRIFYQASRNFVPLGGNTVFIKRDLLQSVGGWPDNLTEDCALGVLLCTRYNAKVVAAYEPALATREEVPHTIANRKRGSLFWQRVRWNQGFLSVMLQGDWLKLPTLRQRALAGYVLATPFMQALSALLLPISIAAILFVKVPVVVAMFMYLPFLPLALITAWQLVGLAEFSRAYGERAKLRHYVSLVLGAPIYAWILMAAAYWAVIRHLRRNTSWYKTVHTGDHRSPSPVLVPRLEEAR